jgi:hypothetical protein
MFSKFSVPEIDGFRLDNSGFSPAYFSIIENPVVSSFEVSQLADITLQTRQSSRICLHKSPDDLLHYMLIAQYRGFNPKEPLGRVFPTKQKVFQPLIGRLLIVCVSLDGTLRSKNLLDPKKQNIQFVQPGQIYLDLPFDEVTVHAEIATGPFEHLKDRIFPTMPWDVDSDKKRDFYNMCMSSEE